MFSNNNPNFYNSFNQVAGDPFQMQQIIFIFNYFIKNSPNLNNKFIKVDLTSDKYTPNSFFYVEDNTESENFGKYCLDDGSFDDKSSIIDSYQSF